MKVCPSCQRANVDDARLCAYCGTALPSIPLGQAAPYLPPTPPALARRGTSPWLWVAMGCLLLTVLMFGSCATIAYFGGKRIAESMKAADRQPLSAQQVLMDLNGVPIYPGAEVDVPTSKTMRAVIGSVGGLMGSFTGGKMKMATGAFVAPAAPETVIAWYDQQFDGWHSTLGKKTPAFGNSGHVTASRSYMRGDRQVQVQVSPANGQRGRSLIVLTQMSGIPNR